MKDKNTKLKILTEPNPILRKISSEISQKDLGTDDFIAFCEAMKDLMDEKNGLGLAAPQIGKNIRVVVISHRNGPLVLANPKITKKSILKNTEEEGCLSLPELFLKVRRHNNVTCEYFDEKGEKKKISARGLLARVIQHELDHLDGVLFIDKAKKIKK